LGKISDALAKSNIGYTMPEAIDVDVSPLNESGFTFFEQTGMSFDSNSIDENIITLSKPYSFEAEQFKKLRTNILFPNTGRSPRSILVTSAVPGEGKSFVAANLSVSIANNIDKHVLLMDCDIRKPCIHSRFGFKNLPGLSEYLSGERTLESVFARTAVNRLAILPGGLPPANPSELLSSMRMTDLLKEIVARYRDRYIVIDAPPPQLCAETNAIARQVDGILLVIKYGSTKQDAINDLIDLFGKKNIIGVVFNEFDSKMSPYSYDSYYNKKS